MGSPSKSLLTRTTLVVVIATFVGFGLRLWPLGRLGLDQFDEGIYAMAATWLVMPGGIRGVPPMLIPYAPPGYPTVAGLLGQIIGFSDQAPLLVSAFLGSVTIPLIALTAGRIFGMGGAVVGAWAISLSGPHIAFSRMVLTDTSFLCVWSIGLLAGICFIEKPTLGRGLFMGAMVGLAQCFKYNGWVLGGLIILAAIMGEGRAAIAGERRDWVRLVVNGGLAVLVASLVVFPWFLFVERNGGYGALLAHQRNYLGGWTNWGDHLRSQSKQANVLGGPVWLWMFSAMTVGWSIWWIEDFKAKTSNATLRFLGGCLAGVCVCPLLAAPGAAGFLVMPLLINKRDQAGHLVSICWLGLFVLTPFYHPYARLWLPFEATHWILVTGLIVRVATLPIQIHGQHGVNRNNWVVLGGIIAILAGSLYWGPGFPWSATGKWHHEGLFEPSDALRLAASEVIAAVPDSNLSIRTIIRPSMTYYLGSKLPLIAMEDPTQLAGASARGDWGLIDSTILGLTGRTFDVARTAELPFLFRSDWEAVAIIPVRLTLVTTLDLSPTNPPADRSASYATFWLIRPRRSHLEP